MWNWESQRSLKAARSIAQRLNGLGHVMRAELVVRQQAVVMGEVIDVVTAVDFRVPCDDYTVHARQNGIEDEPVRDRRTLDLMSFLGRNPRIHPIYCADGDVRGAIAGLFEGVQ